MARVEKVLIVIETLNPGGAEKMLSYLLPRLRDAGVDCQVAALWPTYELAPVLEAEGIRVHQLDVWHRWMFFDAVFKIVRICKEERFSLIWGHLYLANVYARLAKLVMGSRVGMVSSLHGLEYTVNPVRSLWQKFRRVLDRTTGNMLSDRTVAVSRAVAADYENHLGWQGLDVIYNPMPLAQMPEFSVADRRLEREKYDISVEERLVVLPGRHVEVKGHRFLLEAMKLLKEQYGMVVHLVAPGSGRLTQALILLANKLSIGSQVTFPEILPQNELYRLLLAADIVVMPSLSEGLSVAAVESMGLGVPIVLSAVGGNVELVEHEVCGLLVPPRDPQATAQAIFKLFDDPEFAYRMGIAGQQRISERFGMERIVLEWVELLRSVSGRYSV